MSTKQKVVKGYKVFNPDFTCNGFKFKVGETFEHKGELKICASGFHFCIKASDCFNYYDFTPKNIVCEVEAIGDVQYKGNNSKACTNVLRIVRILDWQEVLVVANEGVENTGHSNSGNCNSGNCNSGDRNSGNCNSGYRNSGAFSNDKAPILYLFNKPTNISVVEWEQHVDVSIMNKHLDPTIWVPESIMSEDEKASNPHYKTTEGYLKTIPLKDAWKNLWGNLSEENKNVFLTLPNFDAEIFEDITGIKTN